MPGVDNSPESRVRFLPTSEASDRPPDAPTAERRVKILSTSLAAPQSSSALPMTAPAPGGQRALVPELVYCLPSGVQVRHTFSGRACSDLARHCEHSNRHSAEVGGVLAGYCHRRRNEFGHCCYHVIVTDAIPVESPNASGSHITFDAACWDRIDSAMEHTFTPEGKSRVGWYHTHPSQGIFFSAYDRDAHSVFRLEHQAALVVDPRNMQAGLFYWADHAQRRLQGPLLFSLRTADLAPHADAPRRGLLIRLSPEAERVVDSFRTQSPLWLGAAIGAVAAFIVAAILPNGERSPQPPRSAPSAAHRSPHLAPGPTSRPWRVTPEPPMPAPDPEENQR